MSAPEFFTGTVTTAGSKTKDMPGGRRAAIQTSAEVTLAFWNDQLGDFGTAETITAPGARFYCPHDRAKFVATGADAKVAVTLLSP